MVFPANKGQGRANIEITPVSLVALGVVPPSPAELGLG